MHSPSINYIGIEDIHRGINVILYDFWDIEQGLQGEEMSILKGNMNVIFLFLIWEIKSCFIYLIYFREFLLEWLLVLMVSHIGKP